MFKSQNKINDNCLGNDVLNQNCSSHEDKLELWEESRVLTETL